MRIEEVLTAEGAKEFIQAHVLLNRQNPAWIRPLDNEVNDAFNPSKNKNYKYGETARWVLKDDNGKLTGRIAAYTHSKYINKGTDYPVGCCGFFDCINDPAAANKLFNTAKEWLQTKGMEAMDGPINFGDREKWWGLLVEGFDEEPVYGMSFNPAYYEKLFEGYGFKNYYNQYYYGMKVVDPLPDRFAERHARFMNKPDYTARMIEKNKLEKYAQDFATIYNAAWAQHDGAKEITATQVMKTFNKMKAVMDERIVWFAYYRDEPIAMWINIPDLNQYFKHFNGRFGLIEKLRLLWMKKTGACRKFTGLAFGVVPKYQAFGIDSFLIYEASFVIQHRPLFADSLEIGWSGDWNPKMLAIYKNLGGSQTRRLVTYRYNFNTSKGVERHPVLEYKR